MAGPIRNLPIGQILVENGFINEKQLQEALDKQKQSGGKMLGDVMLEMGLVSETQLAQALSIRLKVPFVDLAAVQINKDAVMKIPEATAREKTVIAFDMHNNRLMVASNDPINFYIFEELKVQTGMEIIPQISTKTQIEEAIGRFYSQQTVNKVMNELDDEAAAAEPGGYTVRRAYRQRAYRSAGKHDGRDRVQNKRVGYSHRAFQDPHAYPFQNRRRACRAGGYEGFHRAA